MLILFLRGYNSNSLKNGAEPCFLRIYFPPRLRASAQNTIFLKNNTHTHARVSLFTPGESPVWALVKRDYRAIIRSICTSFLEKFICKKEYHFCKFETIGPRQDSVTNNFLVVTQKFSRPRLVFRFC